MKTGHLFAGAGGGLLADVIVGHKPIWAVEWDRYCCAVLRERFPSLQVVEGDVRSVDFRQLDKVDVLSAGFPCQDISSAGTGKGINGSRSGLYREVIRAVDELQPSYVFLENSPLIRTRGRHIVIRDLVERGYSWRDGLLSASDVGAPHKRLRWWLLARRGGHPDRLRELQQEGGEPNLGNGLSNVGEDVPHTHCNGLEGWEHYTGGCREVCEADLAPAASCCSGWWSTEPGMGRVVDGLANRAHRIKALGNGQVPIQAAVAMKLLGLP